MVWPSLSPHQDRSGALDEQRPQIAVASLGYARENRSIAGRDLLGHKAKPRSKISPFRKGVAGSDRGDHGARCNWSDAGGGHETLAMLVLVDERLDLRRRRFDPCIKPAPVFHQVFNEPQHSWRENVRTRRQQVRQRGSERRGALSNRHAAFEKEAADLVDHRGPLSDESTANPMKRLKIKLLRALQRHEPHRRPLDRFGDRFRVAIIVLVALEIRLHILRGHQPNLMAHGFELSAKMVGSCASLHADQTRRNIGERTFELMS